MHLCYRCAETMLTSLPPASIPACALPACVCPAVHDVRNQYVLHRCGACNHMPPALQMYAAIMREQRIANETLVESARRVVRELVILG